MKPVRLGAGAGLASLYLAIAVAAIPACSGDDDGRSGAAAGAGGGDAAAGDEQPDSDAPDMADEVSFPGMDASDGRETGEEAGAPPCPDDMVLWGGVCIDSYEAPNVAGRLPLVMYNLVEAEAWCQARGKRLCYDDEWQAACEGPNATSYPYGDLHEPGVCNDDKTWLTYNQSLLDGWPSGVSTPEVESLDALLDAARAVSVTAAAAADHVEWLYQGSAAGDHPGCTGPSGVFDLCGNVEEWTLRRDGGTADFHGNLKGRYWAESRTCQGNVKVHGDYFRFYEIGFRCCRDP